MAYFTVIMTNNYPNANTEQGRVLNIYVHIHVYREIEDEAIMYRSI